MTQQEKERMWLLYQQYGTFKAVAKKINRSPDTVSRYVREFEAARAAAKILMNCK